MINKIDIGDLVTWDINIGTRPNNVISKTFTGILVEVHSNFMGGHTDIFRVLVEGEVVEVSSENKTLRKVNKE